MKKISRQVAGFLLLIFLTLIHLPIYAAQEFCSTYEHCKPSETCTCYFPAEGAYDRYFYFDISPLLKENTQYICSIDPVANELSANNLSMQIDLANSIFPEGTSYECIDCTAFPLKLILNTTNMLAEKSIMEIRYVVGPSDVPPGGVSIHCAASENNEL